MAKQADNHELHAKVAELEAKVAELTATNRQLEARNDELEVAAVKAAADRRDRETEELALRLLWQAHRTTYGATHTEISNNFARFRQWIGESRAEELERVWRTGRGGG